METIQFLDSAFKIYPIDIVFGVLWYSDEDCVGLPKQSPIQEEWGYSSVSMCPLDDYFSIPHVLDIVYLSIIERKFYSIESGIPSEYIEYLLKDKDDKGCNIYNCIIVGLTPYGGIALWLSGNKKETLIGWLRGDEIDISMEEYLPHDPTKKLDDYCDSFINADEFVKTNLEKYGLPPRDLFDNYMKQFTYRYQVLMEKWQGDDAEVQWERYGEEEEIVPEFEWIEESLYDGTHDKLHDGGLMQFHEAGKPKKLAVQFHRGKAEYTAYFWFEDEKIREVFDKFYGAHPETKTDFIIRIDAENKKYELALYRYGLKEPVVIKEDVYQLLVFKNKFEDYRSENYDQPRGAWSW